MLMSYASTPKSYVLPACSFFLVLLPGATFFASTAPLPHHAPSCLATKQQEELSYFDVLEFPYTLIV